MEMKKIVTLFILMLACMPFAFAQLSGFGNVVKYNYASLDFSLINQDPLPAWAGQSVELNFNIQNTGVQGATNVEVVLNPDFPFALATGESGKRVINEIAARQKGEDSVSLSFNLLVDPDASEATYDIELEYLIDGTKYQRVDPFDINVKAKSGILMLESITSTPSRVSPGQEMEINLAFGATGNQILQDVVISMETDELPVSIIGSSNEKVISRLNGGETENVLFKLIVGPDAESKVYDIPVEATYYEVGSSESKTYESHVSLVVDRSPEYILNLEESEVFVAGQNGEVILSMSNVGPSDINYVTLEILPSTEYEVISTNKVYLGNLESDDFETTEFNLYVGEDVGESLDLKFKTTFKDSYNKDYEEDVSLPLNLYSTSKAKEYGLISNGNSNVWIFVVLIVVAIGGYLLYRRRKSAGKKK
jgi:hypothetical protein